MAESKSVAVDKHDKMDPNNRFAVIEDKELEKLFDAADSKNTKRQINYSVRILSQYCETRNCTLADVEQLPVDQLDSFLKKFYPALRKEDGSLYSKKSMQGIRYGIQRHFSDIRGFDIVKGTEFSESSKSFKAMLVKLKDAGLGYVQHKPVISKPDFAKIQAAKSLDVTTPRGLQNKVFIDIMLFLCGRGQENLREMKASDFTVTTDEDGLRSVTRRDMLTKNNREGADEKTGGMMCEVPGDARCPVKSLLEYTSRLNPKCPAFWQKPKEKAPEDPTEPWYCNMPVGINTLNKKIKEISKEAGCSKIYTNHCLRATCVTVLDQAGFQNRDIMSVSGHHSEQSIKHYSRTSNEKKRQMSAIIARKAIEHDKPGPGPSTSTSINSSSQPRPSSKDPSKLTVGSTPVDQLQPSVSGPRPYLSFNDSVDHLQPKQSKIPRHDSPNVDTSSVSGTLQPRLQPRPCPSPVDDLPVLTDSQEQSILQEVDITNAFNTHASSHHDQTLNFHGCTVNFYNNSHQ